MEVRVQKGRVLHLGLLFEDRKFQKGDYFTTTINHCFISVHSDTEESCEIEQSCADIGFWLWLLRRAGTLRRVFVVDSIDRRNGDVSRIITNVVASTQPSCKRVSLDTVDNYGCMVIDKRPVRYCGILQALDDMYDHYVRCAADVGRMCMIDGGAFVVDVLTNSRPLLHTLIECFKPEDVVHVTRRAEGPAGKERTDRLASGFSFNYTAVRPKRVSDAQLRLTRQLVPTFQHSSTVPYHGLCIVPIPQRVRVVDPVTRRVSYRQVKETITPNCILHRYMGIVRRVDYDEVMGIAYVSRVVATGGDFVEVTIESTVRVAVHFVVFLL